MFRQGRATCYVLIYIELTLHVKYVIEEKGSLSADILWIYAQKYVLQSLAGDITHLLEKYNE